MPFVERACLREVKMAVRIMDLKGLKCPQPTLKMTIELHSNVQKGDVLEAVADCPTFENDVKSWCSRNKKIIIWLRDEGGGAKRCQIQL